MAIEHKLIFKGHKILVEEVIDYCLERYINFEVLNDKNIYLDDWGLTLCFLCNQEKNIWQSQVYNVDFLYDETIIFRLGKDCENWEKQMDFIVNYVFNVMTEKNREGIFVYNSDNEICYFKADDSINVDDDLGVIHQFLKSRIN